MDKTFEKKYHRLENVHCWFKARREIILHLIIGLKPNKEARILEIGCSGGLLLKSLEKNGFDNVYGIDISESAIIRCKENGVKNASLDSDKRELMRKRMCHKLDGGSSARILESVLSS